MKNYTILVLVMMFLATPKIFSQEEIQLTSKDSIVQSSWMFGLGFNAVDDSGDAFNDFTTIKDQWNILPYPTRLSIGRYFKNGLGLEAIGTYNKYKIGTIIEGVPNTIESDYYGLDSRLSYDLNKLVGETGWFDPYIGVGLGYTEAANVGRGTYNGTIGFRAWFSDRIGIDLNTTGKWAMGNEATNHIQHAAGVVYQFGIEKGLSKKGQEKLAFIEAMEKEKQRVADSLANVRRVEEEALMAKRLAEEKEKARLAAEVNAKIEAENHRKQQIENSIKELGFVYFRLNSSYLNKESKTVLDAMAQLLKKTPSVHLKITSHTDSRGTSSYNKWLSERRVEKTKEYLVSLGIVDHRLETEALGEEKLANECDDNTPCSEEKHKENRRSEFIVKEF